MAELGKTSMGGEKLAMGRGNEEMLNGNGDGPTRPGINRKILKCYFTKRRTGSIR